LIKGEKVPLVQQIETQLVIRESCGFHGREVG